MVKIPLEATLVGAYRFLFTRIVSIVGTMWFPSVLVLALTAGLVYLVVPHAWFAGDFSHFKPGQVMTPQIWAARGIIGLAGAIAGAMILVGLMRHALGLKQSVTLIYFSLGAPVWRMLGALILGGVIMGLLFAGLGVAAGLLIVFGAKFAAAVPQGYLVAGGIVLGGVAGFFAVYAAVRLFFFLPAVVVAENRIGLGRSWSLGGGNFWRIFFVWLLVVVPVGFVTVVALEMTILPVAITEAMKLPKHPVETDILAFMHHMIPLLPAVATILVLQSIAMRGLMTGAIGSAYKAVTAGRAEAAAPAEGAASP